ncbi:hypothetical protein DFP72DRAFT_851374 [Ephemerocybe angulata]|uniref:Uncharacterized protein n=1 Tax=Ephemerocybe angulata TaxID=980116 RepID=A0A8H6M3H4_9AGAR|nr:hypothetical protein DFP72DRAFT_851374 [Tulosesus angulatus]
MSSETKINIERKIPAESEPGLPLSGTAAVHPALSCARIDTNPDNRQQILQAQQWFGMWHGILSYAIAVSIAIEGASGSKHSNRNLPRWMEILLVLRKEYLQKVEGVNMQNEVYRNHPQLWPSALAIWKEETFDFLPDDKVLDDSETFSHHCWYCCHHKSLARLQLDLNWIFKSQPDPTGVNWTLPDKLDFYWTSIGLLLDLY